MSSDNGTPSTDGVLLVDRLASDRAAFEHTLAERAFERQPFASVRTVDEPAVETY